MTVGRNIRNRREKIGLYQSELAERAEITQAQISRIERDKREPSLSTIKKIASVLRCSVDELIGTDNRSA